MMKDAPRRTRKVFEFSSVFSRQYLPSPTKDSYPHTRPFGYSQKLTPPEGSV